MGALAYLGLLGDGLFALVSVMLLAFYWTLERDRVLRSFVTQLTGNAPIVEVPLEENDAPNVFVSIISAPARMYSS